MASSEAASRLDAKRPIVLVLLSLLAFVALDAAIFRSGLYARISSTKSVPGQFAAVVRYRIGDRPTGKRDVLLLGHSKIEAAFSQKQFEQENPDSKLQIVLGSSGGTTEKMWYYLLKHIDPGQRRFAAIVIPIDSYRTQAVGTDCDNLIDVAQVLAPMLDASEWRDLIGTYTDPEVRRRVTVGALVSSHFYAVDVQDLLLHPIERYESQRWVAATARTFLYDFEGFEGDVQDLVVDPVTAKIVHAPAHLDPFRRAEAEARFVKPPPDLAQLWTKRYHAFRKEWFSRIVDLYAHSDTTLVFVQVPRWPFEMPVLMPIEGAPDLRDYVKPSSKVVVVDESTFVDLERPMYFFDVLHVNKVARQKFTSRFGKKLREALGDAP